MSAKEPLYLAGVVSGLVGDIWRERHAALKDQLTTANEEIARLQSELSVSRQYDDEVYIPEIARLREVETNAPWLSLAHTICTDTGIEQGHIKDRLTELREYICNLNHDAERAGKCTWGQYSYAGNDNGNWQTDCENEFCFIDGGPTDNGMKFCCYCGKRLVEKSYEAEPLEDDCD